MSSLHLQNVVLEVNWVSGECEVYRMPDQMSQFQQREEVLVESTSGSDKVLCFNIFAKRCGKVVQICSSKQVKLGLLEPVIDN